MLFSSSFLRSALGLLFLSGSSLASASSLSCISDTGAAIDWWAGLKSSKERASSDANVQEGLAYVYTDSKKITSSKALQNFGSSLEDSASMLMATLDQAYTADGQDDTGFIFYNDEEPEGKTSSSYGHTKGVLAFNSQGGFWLIHSMPKFPDGPSSLQNLGASSPAIPSSARIYGQSMLCVSLNVTGVNAVGKQFQYSNPQVYASQSASGISSFAPDLDDFLNNGKKETSTGAKNIIPLSSRGGASFMSFMKNAKWGQDLYHDLIAPYYSTDVLVESWMRPFEDSNTNPPYSAIDITKVCITDSICFKETDDHSKWTISSSSSSASAVSAASDKHLVCIGDINKQLSQSKRGGGTMCIQNVNLHTAFAAVVSATESDEVNEEEQRKEQVAEQVRQKLRQIKTAVL